MQKNYSYQNYCKKNTQAQYKIIFRAGAQFIHGCFSHGFTGKMIVNHCKSIIDKMSNDRNPDGRTPQQKITEI